MATRLLLLALLIPASLSASCSQPVDASLGSKVRVFVSILPQAYFAERIGGDHVAVTVLVGPGQTPHSFSPTPKQMTTLSQAQVFFRVGMPFEDTLLPKIASANPNLPIVDLRKGVKLRKAGEDEACEDCTGGDGHEGHGELDPHIWLDIGIAKSMCTAMCARLKDLDPDHAADFEKNLATLLAELDALDKRIAKTLAPLQGAFFYVFHPAFGYFADRYGLHQVAVETGGKSPGPRHIQQIIKRAQEEGVNVIFVQPQFDASAAKTIAEQIDGVVVPMDSLAKDYVKNLEDLAGKIDKALGAE